MSALTLSIIEPEKSINIDGVLLETSRATKPTLLICGIYEFDHFWGDYVNMIASRKSDQRIYNKKKLLTLPIYKDLFFFIRKTLSICKKVRE
ncbi:hypothetical protein RIR_jg10612.t1 [Rhizophagus irregularis DAOM 181602=DAOM 197198]|uniref:Uncharacterized protein n=1 Tax=Rhizophagus irregularis (strain DAOM 181602 / DAOM 197198 / MUCL 43194) TaxID=747089 RepID=U9U7L5_RHIID|nr:hypothetical protein RIR_jg10612.t1 [Rhizophagus irregularis DAOM 181602=DAOM 197198]